MVRLNKYLSDAGVCSRREADRLIESGQVSVDGQRAVPGMKVADGQKEIKKNDDECVQCHAEKNDDCRYLTCSLKVVPNGTLT